jgi:ADP-heptose:LPS heptosyltransferase
MLWPVPALAPCRRSELVFRRPGALGDVLLCTPALHRLKQVNPGCRVVFLTKYPQVLHGLPFIDEVLDSDTTRVPDALDLGYEHALPPRRHIARVIGDLLGLRVPDVRPRCAVDRDLVARYAKEWAALPRPWVVINRRAGPFTPNKDWPDGHWDVLVRRLARTGTAIEIGGPTPPVAEPVGGSYVDLRGRTSLPELVAVLAATDLHVGPISGPVHVAAAVGKPGVVIYGGYEDPSCSGYRRNINLYSPVPCSPCWLRTPCPKERVCLTQISPDRVEQALRRLWRQRPRMAVVR